MPVIPRDRRRRQLQLQHPGSAPEQWRTTKHTEQRKFPTKFNPKETNSRRLLPDSCETTGGVKDTRCLNTNTSSRRYYPDFHCANTEDGKQAEV